eukprot:2317706-Rhodomonas_salina.2
MAEALCDFRYFASVWPKGLWKWLSAHAVYGDSVTGALRGTWLAYGTLVDSQTPSTSCPDIGRILHTPSTLQRAALTTAPSPSHYPRGHILHAPHPLTSHMGCNAGSQTGSTFYFTLPLPSPPRSRASSERDPSEHDPSAHDLLLQGDASDEVAVLSASEPPVTGPGTYPPI